MPTLPLASGRVNDTWQARDDFHCFVDNTNWTVGGNTNAAISVSDLVGGVVTLTPTDAANNWQAFIKGTSESFQFTEKASFVAEGRIKFAEAATNAANVAFGVTNAVAVSLMVDDGAGMKATGDYAAIYKIDGETVWRCKTLLNGTSYGATTSTVTAGGAYQTLSIRFTDKAGSNSGTVEYFVDDRLIGTHNITTYSSSTQMEPFFFVKNGTSAAQTLLIDTFAAEGVALA